MRAEAADPEAKRPASDEAAPHKLDRPDPLIVVSRQSWFPLALSSPSLPLFFRDPIFQGSDKQEIRAKTPKTRKSTEIEKSRFRVLGGRRRQEEPGGEKREERTSSPNRSESEHDG